MTALFLIGMLAFFAWVAGLNWLVYTLLVIILLIIVSFLLTMFGVTRRRQHAEKYHPIHNKS